MIRAPLRRQLERLCWGLAVLGGAGYVGGRALGQHEHEAALTAFDRAMEVAHAEPPASWRLTPDRESEASPSMPGIVVDPPLPDTSSWSPPRVDHYRRALGGGDAADAVPLAVLHIPRLALQVPVYAELNERNLNRGAAVVATVAAPAQSGNLAVAGHRDGWFRGLEDAEVGDLIEVQDLAARRRFRITELSVVEPTDLTPLEPTEQPSLTLITCYPFRFVGSAPQRYIVRAIAQP